MDKKKDIFKLICLLLVFFGVCPLAGFAQDKKIFKIGTGGKTGVYYPIGKLIAHGLTEPYQEESIPGMKKEGVPGYIAVALSSAGSVENIENIVSGENEAGLVQADAASRAYQTSGSFSGKKEFKMIRAVASLYPEKFQMVTRRDADIRNMTDLKGKHISLDEVGSGTLSVMRIILAAHGLSEKQLLPVYLKPLFTQEKMLSGELQGFAMMAGTPMESVLNLSGIGISLVPIKKEIAENINRQYPYLVPGIIPADVYPGLPETSTIQVHSLLAVSAAMDEELVYRVTCALWSQRTLSLLRQGHPQGKMITLDTALIGLSIPLHQGAKRYYREQGLLAEESVSE